jgi:hypothetical protein
LTPIVGGRSCDFKLYKSMRAEEGAVSDRSGRRADDGAAPDDLATLAAVHSLGSYKEVAKAYEEGKHRRYELMFAVNGGGFAVASVFKEITGKTDLVGNLTVHRVALGMMAFTAVMYLDILVFGFRMRYAGHKSDAKSFCEFFSKYWRRIVADFFYGIFSPFGAVILTLLCALIIGGWASVVGWL